MDNRKKWKLNSSGRFVEDVLYLHANECDQEDLAHSFVLCTLDKKLEERFNDAEWKEVRETNYELAPPIPQEIQNYFDRIILKKGNFKHFYSAIKKEDFDPDKEFDLEWAQRSLLDMMYREGIIGYLDEQGSEKDLIIRLWRFFGTCFDRLKVQTQSMNQNKSHDEYSARATKPDLVLFKNGLEFGGKIDGGGKSEKENYEKNLKNPKTLKNMIEILSKKIKNNVNNVHELQVIGFIHFHLRAQLSSVDIPKVM